MFENQVRPVGKLHMAHAEKWDAGDDYLSAESSLWGRHSDVRRRKA